MSTNVYAQTFSIGGFLRGHTRYTVSFDDTVPDEFGQTLTGKKTFTFDIGPADPAIYASGPHDGGARPERAGQAGGADG